MQSKYLKMVATLAIAGSLTAACSKGTDTTNTASGGGNSSTPTASMPAGHGSTTGGTTAGKTTETAAATTRAVLTAQLQEHVYLAGIATGTALSAGPTSAAYKAAAATLDKNSVQLSETVGSVYGDAGGKQFLDLWRKHIGFFVEYTLGAAKNDTAMKNAAVKKLDGYRADFGAFLESATEGGLPKAAVAEELVPHIQTLAAAVDAQAAKSPTAYDKLKTAADHMPMTAAILAGAIATQKNLAG
jgi:hypothetical protein